MEISRKTDWVYFALKGFRFIVCAIILDNHCHWTDQYSQLYTILPGTPLMSLFSSVITCIIVSPALPSSQQSVASLLSLHTSEPEPGYKYSHPPIHCVSWDQPPGSKSRENNPNIEIWEPVYVCVYQDSKHPLRSINYNVTGGRIVANINADAR